MKHAIFKWKMWKMPFSETLLVKSAHRIKMCSCAVDMVNISHWESAAIRWVLVFCKDFPPRFLYGIFNRPSYRMILGKLKLPPPASRADNRVFFTIPEFSWICSTHFPFEVEFERIPPPTCWNIYTPVVASIFETIDYRVSNCATVHDLLQIYSILLGCHGHRIGQNYSLGKCPFACGRHGCRKKIYIYISKIRI